MKMHFWAIKIIKKKKKLKKKIIENSIVIKVGPL